MVEAVDAVNQLSKVVKDMEAKVEALERRQVRSIYGSILTNSQSNTSSIHTVIRPSSQCPGSEVEALPYDYISSSTFDEDLKKSWAYMRIEAFRRSTTSFSTLEAGSTAWSCLSGLSLSQVSSIAVIDLPITMDDVYSPRHFVQVPLASRKEPARPLNLDFEVLQHEARPAIPCEDPLKAMPCQKCIKV